MPLRILEEDHGNEGQVRLSGLLGIGWVGRYVVDVIEKLWGVSPSTYKFGAKMLVGPCRPLACPAVTDQHLTVLSYTQIQQRCTVSTLRYR